MTGVRAMGGSGSKGPRDSVLAVRRRPSSESFSTRLRTLGAIAFAGAFAGVVAVEGCTLDAIGEGPPLEACDEDADCAANDNPCTAQRCVDGTCIQGAVADGPVNGQPAGDCELLRCTSGELSASYDEGDTPDDKQPCTADACSPGGPVHTPRADGEVCVLGSSEGNCRSGTCEVSCSADDLDGCPGFDDPCKTPSCVDNVCMSADISGEPRLDVPDTMGDCVRPICDAGVLSSETDASDVLDDGSDCTLDSCSGPNPVNDPKPVGTGCTRPDGSSGFCDAAGECGACATTANCPTGSDCFQGKCFSCDDKTQNGAETGEDCGTPLCGDCNGTPCTTGSSCKSGACVDGVCCDQACDGLCEACTFALSGSPSGTCRRLAGPSAVDCPSGQACCGAQCISAEAICE